MKRFEMIVTALALIVFSIPVGAGVGWALGNIVYGVMIAGEMPLRLAEGVAIMTGGASFFSVFGMVFYNLVLVVDHKVTLWGRLREQDGSEKEAA